MKEEIIDWRIQLFTYYIIVECANFRSMLNCVNSLEPQSMNSGIEHAALMISEEKTQHDSRKNSTLFIPNRNAYNEILIIIIINNKKPNPPNMYFVIVCIRV